MQHPFSCMPATYDAIESTLSPARLARYLPAAKGDKHLALRLYVWNARICEAMYFPIQLAEVAARNAISIPIRKRFGPEWFTNSKFTTFLPRRHKDTLNSALRKEHGKRGRLLNQDHMIAGLPFGFWVSLMTSAFDRQLWANGVVNSFPNAGRLTRSDIYSKLDKLRNFRNDIPHHYAIFDRSPQAEYQNALSIAELICHDTHWMLSELSRVSTVINQRPKA